MSFTEGHRPSRRYGSERGEDFEKYQLNAIMKTVNTEEVAAKEKHVRTLILSTHRDKSSVVFWSIIGKIQLEANPVTTWKFCYVLHKLLRDGYANVLRESLKFRTKLSELGKLWKHLKDGYGILIALYCRLLIRKLEFHKNNPNVPGNLALNDSALEALAGNDVNNHFQLAIEMLDYIDDILALQHSVFDSMDMSRANSLTARGQCRLSPLILCILDSNCLYDCLVKLLFKLHSALPADVLVGHRNRFNEQFKKLSQFYYTSSNLQYFKYLVTIPTLPNDPPNFLEASEFDDYVPPQVLIHQQSEQDEKESISGSATDTLVDLTNDGPSISPLPNGSEPSDWLVNSLKHDLQISQSSREQLETELKRLEIESSNRISILDQELTQSKHLINQLTDENERNRNQWEILQNEKNLATDSQLSEYEKMKEKHFKVKEAYAKLREEHIDSLKKIGQANKELETFKKTASESENQCKQMEIQLNEFRVEKSTLEEKMQSTSNNVEDLSNRIAPLNEEIHSLKMELSEKETSLVRDRAESQRNIDAINIQLDQKTKNIDRLQSTHKSNFKRFCDEAIRLFNQTLLTCDDPTFLTVTCWPEFVQTRIEQTRDSLSRVTSAVHSWKESNESPESTEDLIASLHFYGNMCCDLLLHGKSALLKNGYEDSECFSNLHKFSSNMFAEFSDNNVKGVEDMLGKIAINLGSFEKLMNELLGGKEEDVNSEQMAELLEKEMEATSLYIQQALSSIQALIEKSRESTEGIRLEVNDKILDSCNDLMKIIVKLVKESRDLQMEIVDQGRGSGSEKDFYKKNSQWTEGLLSAAKSVGICARTLVETADRFISKGGKFEELMAASQQIAAGTAQLVVASKVKASPKSSNLSALTDTSKLVGSKVAALLASCRQGRETLHSKDALDFSHLTLHQAKKAEMESQVRLLELEVELSQERQRLGELRKRHYELAADEEEQG